MNILFTNTEETTSGDFGQNQTQVALYPAVIKFMLPGENKVRKGGIAFVSKDRLHDFQQSKCLPLESVSPTHLPTCFQQQVGW